MILKPSLDPREVQACIELMRKGLQVHMDGPDPETAIAAYMRVVHAFASAERVDGVHEESKPSSPVKSRKRRA